jgi:hypothetical protein
MKALSWDFWALSQQPRGKPSLREKFLWALKDSTSDSLDLARLRWLLSAWGEMCTRLIFAVANDVEICKPLLEGTLCESIKLYLLSFSLVPHRHCWSFVDSDTRTFFGFNCWAVSWRSLVTGHIPIPQVSRQSTRTTGDRS